MTETKISKAVICCGGRATRFAPISRAVPKEMLPINDKPVIYYILHELVNAGITDILLLIGSDREVLQKYVDDFADDANIYYRRVPVPRGAADNIWHAKSFVGNDHFIVAYCDDVFFEGNPTRELIADFASHGKPVLTVFKVPAGESHKYGIYTSTKIVEKPCDYVGNLAAVGRYLLSPAIFGFIEQEMPVKGKEICMTEQLNKIAGGNNLRAVKTAAKRFDTGTPRGLFNANKYVFKEKT